MHCRLKLIYSGDALGMKILERKLQMQKECGYKGMMTWEQYHICPYSRVLKEIL